MGLRPQPLRGHLRAARVLSHQCEPYDLVDGRSRLAAAAAQLLASRSRRRTVPGVLITNHVLAGAIVGSLSTSKRSAFLAGLVSHAAMDSIPHMGARDRKHFLTLAVVDGLVGAATMAAITRLAPAEKRARVVAGMAGATLPDADKPSREFFGRSPFPAWVDKAHGAIQIESPDKLGQEVLVGSLAAAVLVGTLRARVKVSAR